MAFKAALAAHGLRAIAQAIDTSDPEGARKLREQAVAVADDSDGLYDVVEVTPKAAEKPTK